MGRIYITPTRFGLIYLGGAVAVIVIGAAYANNLANMLAFFMLSLAAVCAVQTYSNLRDVRVEAVETQGGFEGEEFVVEAVLANDSKIARFNLELRLKGAKSKNVYYDSYRISGGSRHRIKASYPAKSRGKYSLSKVRIHSVFPLGMFRAWRWFSTEASYFVYPRPVGELAIPESSSSGEADGRTLAHQPGEDFSGHRKYQTGDSLHHVDWKARARGRPLMIKEFNEGTAGAFVLDWSRLEGLETEKRLSQLSRWVEDSRQRGITFGMVIPGAAIPGGQGFSHAVKCWEALASFETKSRSA